MKTIAVLLLIVCSICGCSNYPASPENSNKGTNGSGFRVLEVIPDTLYYGEEGWLRINQLSRMPSLKLFIHTIPVTLSSSSGDTVFFTVPLGASTARPRLYRSDSLADGNSVLHVYPQLFDSLRTYLWMDSMRRGLPGDPVIINGVDIPLRRSDFSVTINGKAQSIEYSDDKVILARLAEGSTSGAVAVKIRERIYELPYYEVMQTGGTLLSKSVYTISLSAFDLPAAGEMASKQGDSATFPLSNLYLQETSAGFNASIQRKGDSIVSTEYWEDETMYAWFDLRLKEVGPNLVSGVLRYKSWRNWNSDSLGTEYSIIIDRMRWYKRGDQYHIYAFGQDISQRVLAFEFLEKNGGTNVEYTEILPGKSGSFELIVKER